MHDGGSLAVLAGKVGADDGMGTLDAMVNGLADVVQKTRALEGRGIETELVCHDLAHAGNLNGVVEDVLAVRGAVTQGTQGPHELGVNVVDLEVEAGLLASLEHLGVHLIGGLVEELLDTRRMDATVGNEVLEGDAGNLATDRVEARELHGLGRVVDDEVHAGHLLESADVAALAADDAALEVIGRNVHRGERDFADVVGGATLDGGGKNAASGALALDARALLALADDSGALARHIVANAIEQLLVGLVGGEAADALEFGSVLALELLDVAGALLNLASLAGELVLLLVERVGATVEGLLALKQAALALANFAGTLGRLSLGCLLLLENLGIGGLPNAEDLFLGGNFRFLLDGLGLLFCAVEYLIGLGLCLSELAACALSGEKQGESRTNDRCSDRNDNVHSVHVLPPGFVWLLCKTDERRAHANTDMPHAKRPAS